MRFCKTFRERKSSITFRSETMRSVRLDNPLGAIVVVVVVSLLLSLPTHNFAHGAETRRPTSSSSHSSYSGTGTPTVRATSAKILNNNNRDSNYSSPSTSSSDSSDSNPNETSVLSTDDDSITEDTQANYKPTDLTVVRLSNQSVVLRWDLPPELPDNLQFFKIQYKKASKSHEWMTEGKEIQPFLRAYQLNGLKPGNYIFVVISVVGEDNFPSDLFKYRLKASSKISPDDLPNQEPPTIFWHEEEHDLIRFKWRYKVKDRDLSNFGFLVYYRAAHQVSEFYIHNTVDENVEIADVDPDTPYEAKVVAYNDVGVSEFSKIISVKTKSKTNDTTVAGATTPSTPVTEDSVAWMTAISTSTITTSTTTKPSVDPSEKLSPVKSEEERVKTVKPTPEIDLSNHKHPSYSIVTKPIKTNVLTFNGSNSTTSTTINSAFEWYIYSVFDTLHLDRSDSSAVIKSSLIITIIPLVLIIFAICLIPCQRRKQKSPPSSPNDSMLEIEINGYFKNSFPGVEKEYSVLSTQDAHHGFVNNHPHINDFT